MFSYDRLSWKFAIVATTCKIVQKSLHLKSQKRFLMESLKIPLEESREELRGITGVIPHINHEFLMLITIVIPTKTQLCFTQIFLQDFLL